MQQVTYHKAYEAALLEYICFYPVSVLIFSNKMMVNMYAVVRVYFI
jgi:hypothetical protein